MKARIGNLEVDVDEKRVRGRREMRHADTLNTGSYPGGTRAPLNRPVGSTPASSPLSFTLFGQLPGGKNAIKTTRTGHRYPNERFKAWRAEAIGQLMRQLPANLKTIAEPVRMACEYTPGDLRTRDVPGMEDAIMHLLMAARVIQDDGLIYETSWSRSPLDRKQPLVRVTLITLTSREG